MKGLLIINHTLPSEKIGPEHLANTIHLAEEALKGKKHGDHVTTVVHGVLVKHGPHKAIAVHTADETPVKDLESSDMEDDDQTDMTSEEALHDFMSKRKK